MITSDKRLLEIYKMGWHDSIESDNPRFYEFTGIERNAYIYGWFDSEESDSDEQDGNYTEDYATDGEILDRIKNSRYNTDGEFKICKS